MADTTYAAPPVDADTSSRVGRWQAVREVVAEVPTARPTRSFPDRCRSRYVAHERALQAGLYLVAGLLIGIPTALDTRASIAERALEIVCLLATVAITRRLARDLFDDSVVEYGAAVALVINLALLAPMTRDLSTPLQTVLSIGAVALLLPTERAVDGRTGWIRVALAMAVVVGGSIAVNGLADGIASQRPTADDSSLAMLLGFSQLMIAVESYLLFVVAAVMRWARGQRPVASRLPQLQWLLPAYLLAAIVTADGSFDFESLLPVTPLIAVVTAALLDD